MLKKISYLLVVLSLFNCSSNDDSSEKIIPVNSTHLLNGDWNVTKIENHNGELLFTECNTSELYIVFNDADDTATWERARINNNGCTSSTYAYNSWGVYANSLGYVRLYNQGTSGSSYRNCKADLIGGNGLRLCIVQVKSGQSNEVISTIPVEEREYYYFTKAN